MNFLQIVIACAIIAVGAFLMIKKARSKRAKKTSPIEPDKVVSPPKLEGKEEKKKTWGQVIKMWLFIIIIVIPVTWGVGKVIWTATLGSILNTFGVNTNGTSASYIWTKKPYQEGSNPSKRTSGYLNAVITKNDGKNFCFTGASSRYDGKYVDENRIEGIWRNPPDGGRWYLEKNREKPNFFKGGITDLDLEEWADLELEIF